MSPVRKKLTKEPSPCQNGGKQKRKPCGASVFGFRMVLFFDKEDAQGARAAVGGDGAAGEGVVEFAAAGEVKDEF